MMNYSNKIIMVPGCLFCPRFQADYSEKNMEWIIKLREYISKCEVSIIQMPCPEASFPQFDKGLRRKPHGLKYYSELLGFQEHCKALAIEMVQLICNLQKSGCDVTTIIGVEHSPTCAVNYIYTHQGMIHSKGIFFKEIDKLLEQKDMDISYIGVNRQHYQKSLREIDNLLHTQ